MATGCGYSYREIDEMYLEEVEEILDYWKDSPPTYQLVALIARILGWKPEERISDEEPPDFGLELSLETAQALGEAAGLPAPIISLEAMREKNRQRMIEIAARQAKEAG